MLTLELEIGLKTVIESIDNRADFKAYMHNYSFAHGGGSRGPRRNGPVEDGFVRPGPALRRIHPNHFHSSLLYRHAIITQVRRVRRTPTSRTRVARPLVSILPNRWRVMMSTSR